MRTFGRQVVTGKPAVGDLARPCKPFSAAGTVAYETTDKYPASTSRIAVAVLLVSNASAILRTASKSIFAKRRAIGRKR